jgi:hypothetical protein
LIIPRRGAVRDGETVCPRDIVAFCTAKKAGDSAADVMLM